MILEIFIKISVFIFFSWFSILSQKSPYNLDEEFLVHSVVGSSISSTAGSMLKFYLDFLLEIFCF